MNRFMLEQHWKIYFQTKGQLVGNYTNARCVVEQLWNFLDWHDDVDFGKIIFSVEAL